MKQFEQSLKEYVKLLKLYHNTLDLMSDKGLSDVDKKIEDSLLYAKQIRSSDIKIRNILDIGSGAGLPGIVLAIALPEWKISLVERRQKRASFLEILKSKLNLTNVQVYNSDVKDLKIEPQAVFTAQAVDSFIDLYCLSRQIHYNKILLISRKGDNWQEEVKLLTGKIDENLFVFEPKKLSNRGNLVTISLVGGKKCRQSE